MLCQCKRTQVQKLSSFSCSQCVDLAGNAFNGYVAMAVTTALVGAYSWVEGFKLVRDAQAQKEELEQHELDDEGVDEAESEEEASEPGDSLFGSVSAGSLTD